MINIPKHNIIIFCYIIHPSTNRSQRSLTSVIGRELLFSTRYRFWHSIVLPVTKVAFKGAKGNNEKKIAWANITQLFPSQVVTHSSNNRAQCCLTSMIWRELEYTTWYRRNLVSQLYHVVNRSSRWIIE